MGGGGGGGWGSCDMQPACQRDIGVECACSPAPHTPLSGLFTQIVDMTEAVQEKGRGRCVGSCDMQPAGQREVGVACASSSSGRLIKLHPPAASGDCFAGAL